MSAERLQKVLANAGIASRRDCEALIEAGRVQINGKVARVLGARVDPEHDEITVDGRPIGEPRPRSYVMLHKPGGVVSTADDPQGRPTVVEMVDLPARLFPVGRLDYDSEGLLLLTDDGELTYRLTHPSYEVEKEYHALLDQAPAPDALRQWRAGVELEGVPTAPAWVDLLRHEENGTWVRVVLHEGRKRQIREVAKLLGYEVLRLIRVREGPIELGDLAAGQWRHLTEAEVELLWEHVGGRDAVVRESVREPRAGLAERSRGQTTQERPAPAGPNRRSRRENGTRLEDSGGPTRQRGAPRRQRPVADESIEQRPPRYSRDRPNEREDTRGFRRTERSPRDASGRRDEGPRSGLRGPRRDDGPRRDEGLRRDDTRRPRRDDGPRRDEGLRRDDTRRPRRDDGPRRESQFSDPRNRSERPRGESRGPRRADDRGPSRDAPFRSRGRDESRGNDFDARRGERGNERRSGDAQRSDQRGPGREWRARQQAQADRKKRTGTSAPRDNRFGSRSGPNRRTGLPPRFRRPRDDDNEAKD